MGASTWNYIGDVEMKIGMMTAWNQDAGPAIHAELVGREWVKMDHELRIFSFLKSDFHGTAIVDQDEEYMFDILPHVREKDHCWMLVPS